MFSITGLLVAMGAACFGVAIGALDSFIVVGAMVMISVGAMMAGGSPALLGGVAFGAFGPHVAGFASGVAATAWAGNKAGLEPGGGRNIAAGGAGWNSPMAYLIGIIFAAIGFVVQWIFAQFAGGAWTDTVALTVVVSALIVRVAFGNCGFLGNKLPKGQGRFARPPAGMEWLPWQTDWPALLFLGIGVSLFGAGLAKTLGAAGGGGVFGFGLGAFSLILLEFGVKIPVSHHMLLLSAVATLASGSIIWGVIIGAITCLVAEFFARLWLIYADTHIDPPACAIAVMTTVSFILASTGIYAAIALP
jgi:hypothetical protein